MRVYRCIEVENKSIVQIKKKIKKKYMKKTRSQLTFGQHIFYVTNTSLYKIRAHGTRVYVHKNMCVHVEENLIL